LSIDGSRSDQHAKRVQKEVPVIENISRISIPANLLSDLDGNLLKAIAT
jgi:hypothetical protein